MMIGKDAQALFLDIIDAAGSPETGSSLQTADLAKISEERAIPYLPDMARFLLGRLSLQRGDFAEARGEWSKLLDSGNSDLAVGASAAIGATYWREGKTEEAIQYFSRAVNLFEQKVTSTVQVEDLVASFLGSERHFYSEMLVEMLAQQERAEEAFNYAERARARALLQTLGNHRLKPEHGADGELLAEAEALRASIARWERQAGVVSPDQSSLLSEDLRQARKRYEHLLVRLKVSNPEYANVVSVDPLNAGMVRKEIPAGTTVVSYFVSSSRVHAWVLDRETFQHVALPMEKADLRRAVCWAAEVGGQQRSAKPIGGCERQEGQAEDLHRRLIAPLLKHIRHSRLMLVPHGDLHYLPFAALRNPDTHRYLVEDYTLTYLPSTSVLPFLRRKETPVRGRALVLGAPEVTDASLGPLPDAGREAATVARLFGSAPLLGAQATEARLHDLQGEIDLLHIAAHGIYEPGSPLFSRIALAPEGEHDGNMEVHEVFESLDLSGVNLVVLSACQTAMGERSGGDEITGLTRAFLYAGSPGVISTLWNIHDAASAVLMEELYRRLLSGDSAADALRKAQLSLLRSPRYEDPYYWAAFGLTGDPQGRWKQRR